MKLHHAASPGNNKARTIFLGGIIMGTVFLDAHGCILLDFLARTETINAVLYIQALLKLRHSLHEKHPMKRHISPQHNNAHPHNAHLTLDKTEKFGWELHPYPSYTLDLAPSDCHLCGLKNKKKDNLLLNIAGIKSAVFLHLIF
jgi:hypothetical protein